MGSDGNREEFATHMFVYIWAKHGDFMAKCYLKIIDFSENFLENDCFSLNREHE